MQEQVTAPLPAYAAGMRRPITTSAYRLPHEGWTEQDTADWIADMQATMARFMAALLSGGCHS